ncbi:MAG: hypothetical protein AAF360_00035 [Pseudomonadota bacterium]
MSRRLAIATRGLRGGQGGALQVVAQDIVVVELEPQEVVLVDGQFTTSAPIVVRRGDTWGVQISVVAADGQTPVDLIGSRVTFSMKLNADDAVFAFQDSILVDASTQQPLVFRPTEAQSRMLAPAIYQADIERRSADGLVVTGWTGRVLVEADITDNQ